MKNLERSALVEKIARIVADQLGIDKNKVIKSNNFVDFLGADSADIVNIVSNIEKEFQIEIEDSWVCLMINVENITIILELITEDKQVELLKTLEKLSSVKR